MCPLEVLVRTNERSELCETVCRIAGIEIFDFEGGGRSARQRRQYYFNCLDSNQNLHWAESFWAFYIQNVGKKKQSDFHLFQKQNRSEI